MNTQLLQISYGLNQIEDAVKRFWEVTKEYKLFAFSGEMGAGKTTFIHYICDMLQVEDTVSSPTFALINEYHYSKNGKDHLIWHMDWYRLKDAAEAINAGMEDCIQSAAEGEATCFIEWPEKALDLFHKPYLWITIETIAPDQRSMTVELMH
jgi:tRNA threonylcarbamoyladenosine biosynthesis protein TsaE